MRLHFRGFRRSLCRHHRLLWLKYTLILLSLWFCWGPLLCSCGPGKKESSTVPAEVVQHLQTLYERVRTIRSCTGPSANESAPYLLPQQQQQQPCDLTALYGYFTDVCTFLTSHAESITVGFSTCTKSSSKASTKPLHTLCSENYFEVLSYGMHILLQLYQIVGSSSSYWVHSQVSGERNPMHEKLMAISLEDKKQKIEMFRILHMAQTNAINKGLDLAFVSLSGDFFSNHRKDSTDPATVRRVLLENLQLSLLKFVFSAGYFDHFTEFFMLCSGNPPEGILQECSVSTSLLTVFRDENMGPLLFLSEEMPNLIASSTELKKVQQQYLQRSFDEFQSSRKARHSLISALQYALHPVIPSSTERLKPAFLSVFDISMKYPVLFESLNLFKYVHIFWCVFSTAPYSPICETVLNQHTGLVLYILQLQIKAQTRKYQFSSAILSRVMSNTDDLLFLYVRLSFDAQFLLDMHNQHKSFNQPGIQEVRQCMKSYLIQFRSLRSEVTTGYKHHCTTLTLDLKGLKYSNISRSRHCLFLNAALKATSHPTQFEVLLPMEGLKPILFPDVSSKEELVFDMEKVSAITTELSLMPSMTAIQILHHYSYTVVAPMSRMSPKNQEMFLETYNAKVFLSNIQETCEDVAMIVKLPVEWCDLLFWYNKPLLDAIGQKNQNQATVIQSTLENVLKIPELIDHSSQSQEPTMSAGCVKLTTNSFPTDLQIKLFQVCLEGILSDEDVDTTCMHALHQFMSIQSLIEECLSSVSTGPSSLLPDRSSASLHESLQLDYSSFEQNLNAPFIIESQFLWETLIVPHLNFLRSIQFRMAENNLLQVFHKNVLISDVTKLKEVVHVGLEVIEILILKQLRQTETIFFSEPLPIHFISSYATFWSRNVSIIQSILDQVRRNRTISSNLNSSTSALLQQLKDYHNLAWKRVSNIVWCLSMEWANHPCKLHMAQWYTVYTLTYVSAFELSVEKDVSNSGVLELNPHYTILTKVRTILEDVNYRFSELLSYVGDRSVVHEYISLRTLMALDFIQINLTYIDAAAMMRQQVSSFTDSDTFFETHPFVSDSAESLHIILHLCTELTKEVIAPSLLLTNPSGFLDVPHWWYLFDIQTSYVEYNTSNLLQQCRKETYRSLLKRTEHQFQASSVVQIKQSATFWERSLLSLCESCSKVHSTSDTQRSSCHQFCTKSKATIQQVFACLRQTSVQSDVVAMTPFSTEEKHRGTLVQQQYLTTAIQTLLLSSTHHGEVMDGSYSDTFLDWAFAPRVEDLAHSLYPSSTAFRAFEESSQDSNPLESLQTLRSEVITFTYSLHDFSRLLSDPTRWVTVSPILIPLLDGFHSSLHSVMEQLASESHHGLSSAQDQKNIDIFVQTHKMGLSFEKAWTSIYTALCQYPDLLTQKERTELESKFNALIFDVTIVLPRTFNERFKNSKLVMYGTEPSSISYLILMHEINGMRVACDICRSLHLLLKYFKSRFSADCPSQNLELLLQDLMQKCILAVIPEIWRSDPEGLQQIISTHSESRQNLINIRGALLKTLQYFNRSYLNLKLAPLLQALGSSLSLIQKNLPTTGGACEDTVHDTFLHTFIETVPLRLASDVQVLETSYTFSESVFNYTRKLAPQHSWSDLESEFLSETNRGKQLASELTQKYFTVLSILRKKYPLQGPKQQWISDFSYPITLNPQQRHFLGSPEFRNLNIVLVLRFLTETVARDVSSCTSTFESLHTSKMDSTAAASDPTANIDCIDDYTATLTLVSNWLDFLHLNQLELKLHSVHTLNESVATLKSCSSKMQQLRIAYSSQSILIDDSEENQDERMTLLNKDYLVENLFLVDNERCNAFCTVLTKISDSIDKGNALNLSDADRSNFRLSVALQKFVVHCEENQDRYSAGMMRSVFVRIRQSLPLLSQCHKKLQQYNKEFIMKDLHLDVLEVYLSTFFNTMDTWIFNIGWLTSLQKELIRSSHDECRHLSTRLQNNDPIVGSEQLRHGNENSSYRDGIDLNDSEALFELNRKINQAYNKTFFLQSMTHRTHSFCTKMYHHHASCQAYTISLSNDLLEATQCATVLFKNIHSTAPSPVVPPNDPPGSRPKSRTLPGELTKPKTVSSSQTTHTRLRSGDTNSKRIVVIVLALVLSLLFLSFLFVGLFYYYAPSNRSTREDGIHLDRAFTNEPMMVPSSFSSPFDAFEEHSPAPSCDPDNEMRSFDADGGDDGSGLLEIPEVTINDITEALETPRVGGTLLFGLSVRHPDAASADEDSDDPSPSDLNMPVSISNLLETL